MSSFCSKASSQGEFSQLSSVDSVMADTVVVPVDTVKKTRNPFKWIARYLRNTNKREDKAFDFSMLFGPSYSAATSVGIGATASGLYSWDRSDVNLPKSNVSLYANASLAGVFSVGLRGNNFLPQDKYRLDYQLMFYSIPSDFWGIGYENGRNDENKSEYDRIKLQFKPSFLFRLNKSIFIGPVLDVEWVNAYGFSNETLLFGEDKSIISTGLGLNFS